MSPALYGSSAIRRFKDRDAIEICDGITFNFYMGLPHMYILITSLHLKSIFTDVPFRASFIDAPDI